MSLILQVLKHITPKAYLVNPRYVANVSILAKGIHCEKIVTNGLSSKFYSTKPHKSLTKSDEIRGGDSISTHLRDETTYEKIKDGSKTIYYTGVIVAGVGVLGMIMYTVFKELFSSNSPNNIYSRLLQELSENENVLNVLGDQIKGFADESRRGHRNRLLHQIVIKDGIKHMLMSFHIQGVRKKGTVKVDLIEDETGSFITRLLYIEVEGLLNPLIIENNITGTKHTTNNNFLSEELKY